VYSVHGSVADPCNVSLFKNTLIFRSTDPWTIHGSVVTVTQILFVVRRIRAMFLCSERPKIFRSPDLCSRYTDPVST
jgi:hypothetical protein